MMTAAPPFSTSGAAEEGAHRGVLISDALGGTSGAMSVWRWEEGGGPITIGRTVRLRALGAGTQDLAYLVRGAESIADGEEGPIMLLMEGGTGEEKRKI